MEIAKENGGNLIVTRSRVFGELEDCSVHFVFGNREVIVSEKGGEVDWGSFS